jgi:hypothetical protein
LSIGGGGELLLLLSDEEIGNKTNSEKRMLERSFKICSLSSSSSSK